MTARLRNPKQIAIRRLSNRFDWHQAKERQYVEQGDQKNAERHHDACRVIAIAVKDEIDDRWPMPVGAWCDCARCQQVLARSRWP